MSETGAIRGMTLSATVSPPNTPFYDVTPPSAVRSRGLKIFMFLLWEQKEPKILGMVRFLSFASQSAPVL